MESYGYIKLPSNCVYDACMNFLQDRKEKEEKAKNESIHKEMNKRFFKTEEEALERTRDPYLGYKWFLSEKYWDNIVEEMAELAATGIKNKRDVYISMDVHRLIADYLR